LPFSAISLHITDAAKTETVEVCTVLSDDDITTTTLSTTWVSWHQKGKPFRILMKQEMMGGTVAVPSAGRYPDHLHLAPDR